MPIHQIYRVWDFLLTNKPEVNLFLAFGILYQFRGNITSQDFNQNMIFISSLKALDLERLIVDATLFAKITPPSLYSLDTLHQDSDETILGSISFLDFIEMRHYSLLIDTRRHFSDSHLIGSVRFPKSVSALKSLMQQYSKFFIILAYDGNHLSKVRFFIFNLYRNAIRLCAPGW